MSDSLPRITEIRAAPLLELRHGAKPNPATNVYTFIEVHTDAGLVGYGSAYTTTDLVRAALGMLTPLLMGEIAIEPERVHEKLEQHNFWRGRGGTVTHAISGIDIALWDITGKALGQPISRLLGGRYREKVKPYSSVSMTLHKDAGSLRAILQDSMARGFKAFKLGWGAFMRTGNPADDEAVVKLARETVGDGEIMVDPGGSTQFWPNTYKQALRAAEMLAAYNVVWFEEALPADDIEGFKLLREHSKVMISSGEVLTRRQSFQPWIEQGALDIVQPDCTKVGGITEARHIGWMAYHHNILTVPHGWNTAMGLAADMHLVAALPTGKWVEYHQPSQVIDGIVTKPFTLDQDGMMQVPTGPGLGIELDMQAIARLG